MAISETLTLDLKPALASVTVLNRQITEATKPRTVKVDTDVSGAGITQLNTGLQNAETHSNALRNTLIGVGVAVTAVGVAAGAALAKIGSFGLQAAGNLEQTQIAFAGILGSGEAAAAFLEKLRVFAAQTPFEFPELAAAAKSLLAVGFNADEVIPIMTRLGNVAATLGVGGEAINGVVRALGQMQGKGKASAEELQQISEQIPGFSAIGAIAESMGISVAEAFDLLSQGAIPADVAIQAILDGMERFPGAAGAMERQSKTLLGVWSTLKDTFRDALVSGILPILPALSAALQGIMPVVQEATKGLGETLGGIFQAAVPILEQALPLIANVLSTVGDLFTNVLSSVVGPALQALGPVIAGLGPILDSLRPAFEAIGQAIANLAASGALDAFISGLAEVFKGIGAVVVALAPQFGTLVEIIARVAALFGGVLGKALEVVAPLLGRLADAILPVLNRLFVALQPAFEAIGQAIVAMSPALTKLGDAFGDIMVALEPLILALGDSLVQIVEALAPVMPQLADAFAELAVAMVPLIPPFVKLAVQVLPPLTDLLVLLLPPLVKLMALSIKTQAAAIALLATALGAIAIAIRDGLVAAVEWLGDRWDEIWPTIQGVLEDAWSAMQPIFDFLVARIDDIRSAAEWLGDRWNEVWPAIQAALEGAWSVMQPIFGFLKDRVDDIRGAVGWLSDRWNEAWPVISGALQTAWSIIKPILESFHGAVQAIIDTIQWLADHAADLFGAIWRGSTALWDAIIGPLNAFWDILKKILGTIQAIIDRLPDLPNMPNFPDVTPGFDIPGVPGVAAGGIVTRPTLLVAGEGGEPEMIVPLSRLDRWIARVVDTTAVAARNQQVDRSFHVGGVTIVAPTPTAAARQTVARLRIMQEALR